MHGYQHKRMGIAASAGIVAYVVLTQAPPQIVLTALTLPAGVMLPDIDHDSSKLGRTRKKVANTIKIMVAASIIGFVGLSYYSGGIWNAVLNAVYLSVMAIIVSVIENNKYVKKQLGFITKHRGMMHTLIPPAFLVGSTLWTVNPYYDYLILGLAIGYIVHLLGDMATVSGAPIAFPFTKSNIRYFAFDTKRHCSYIEFVCNLWCVIFIGVGIYFGIKGGL